MYEDAAVENEALEPSTDTAAAESNDDRGDGIMVIAVSHR